MATFLSLCQAVARRSGTVSGTQPATVTGQTGRLNDIVQFVSEAWNEIQSKRDDWKWMNRSWSGSTISGTQAYTPAGLSISNHADWDIHAEVHCYLTSAGEANEWRVPFLQDWDAFRSAYLRGTVQSGAPRIYGIRPYDQALVLFPKPDAAYTLSGEYRKTNQTLSVDADEPEMPARFHDAIMWRALELLHDYDEADVLAAKAMREYGKHYSRLVSSQTPPVSLGRTLA